MTDLWLTLWACVSAVAVIFAHLGFANGGVVAEQLHWLPRGW